MGGKTPLHPLPIEITITRKMNMENSGGQAKVKFATRTDFRQPSPSLFSTTSNFAIKVLQLRDK